MIIAGCSTALYSTWLHVPDLRLLIDAGDGAAAALRSACKEIDVIAITHQHRDHVAGLLEVLSWSALKRPCRIVYPAGSEIVEGIRESAERQGVACAAQAQWIAVQAGEGIPVPVDPRLRLVAFRVQHAVGGRTDRAIGYAVAEGDRIRLVVTGDSRGGPLELPGQPEVLVRDCTYLRPEDAQPGTGGREQHGALDDVLAAAAVVPPGHLVLYHLNELYSRGEAEAWIESVCRESGVGMPVSVLWPDEYVGDVLACPIWRRGEVDAGY